MEVDPQFEFECPHWVDFDEEGEELTECLDDSWFGRDHPMHEPEYKDKNVQELKPLIDVKDHENGKNTSNSATATAKGKKSLGLKQSVTMQRTKGRRMLPDISQVNKRKNADNEHDRTSGGKLHAFPLSENRHFTPPSTIASPLSANTPLSSLYSPLRGRLGSSPSVVNSPKRKLIAKALSNAANADGQRKKRRLPATPNECQEASSLLPQRGQSASDNLELCKSSTLDQSPVTLEPIINNFNHKTATNQPPHKDNSSTEDDKSLQEMLKMHNQKVMAFKSKYDSNGRRIRSEISPQVTPSNTDTTKNLIKKPAGDKSNVSDTVNKATSVKLNSRDASKKKTNEETVLSRSVKNSSKRVSSVDVKLNSIDEVETNVEDLLRMHNRRLAASKRKYDSNGRRVLPGHSTFCPTPSKPEASVSKSTLGRTSSQSSVQKNSSKQPSNEGQLKTKHHRRSCIAAPTSLTAETKTDLTDRRNITKSTAKEARKSKRRSCIEVSGTSSLVAGAAQKSQKQKRRSCFAAPHEGSRDVDDELKGLIEKHNKRLAMLK